MTNKYYQKEISKYTPYSKSKRENIRFNKDLSTIITLIGATTTGLGLSTKEDLITYSGATILTLGIGFLLNQNKKQDDFNRIQNNLEYVVSNKRPNKYI